MGRGVEGMGELKRWEKGDDKGISFLFGNFSYGFSLRIGKFGQYKKYT